MRAFGTGSTQGFDEFMNVVLEDATEIYVKSQKPKRDIGASPLDRTRTSGRLQLTKSLLALRSYIGRIMLKGDNITLIQAKAAA